VMSALAPGAPTTSRKNEWWLPTSTLLRAHDALVLLGRWSFVFRLSVPSAARDSS